MYPTPRGARAAALLCALAALLAACGPRPAPPPTATPPPAGPVGTVAPPAATVPAASPTPPPATAAPEAGAGQYALGQAGVAVRVSNEAEEPLELRGTVAAPVDPGPHPVVVVLHGSHSVCPMVPQSPEEPMICPQATQLRNDPGLGYLLEALAARGYIALAPDLNTAFRAAFGGLEQERDRLRFVVERHLERLAAADPAFGLSPAVAPDPERLFLVGHSRGGAGVYELADAWAANAPPPGGWAQPGGMLLIAPTAPPQAIDFAPPFHTPLAVILPACDGDASFLEGQHYVEAARLYPDRRAPAVAYFLPGANHNFFNAAVAADDGRNGFSRCSEATPRIDRAAQEAFLAGLTPDLLAAWESGDVGAIPALDLAAPIPDALYGAPALTSPFPPAPQRRAILPGTSSDELALSPLGGAVAATGATLDFCPYGMVGSGSPCREGVSVPGTPAMLHLAWEAPGAAVTIAVPPAYADATAAAALQLRLAVDPLDPRSAAGTAQELRVVLRDAAGAEASQPVSVAFPSGQALRDAWFGHVFLGAARLPLGLFPGVDLARLAAVELRPAREAGAIFLADLELVSGGEAIAGPPPPSRYRSLAVRAVAPSLGVIPPGSTLFVRLFEAGAEGEALRFLTIQSGPVGGADVAPFTVRYHRAAVDGRVEYVIEADLQTPAGESLAARPPVPAIVRGVAFGPFELSLAPVVVAEPTPIPTDATFRLTMIAPPGRPFPPGALINVTLSRLDAQGDGVETIVGVSRILEGAPAESVLVELPYMSGRVLAGEPYGVSVDVFAADGIARLTAPGPTTIVDLAAGEAEVRLEAATP